MADDVSVVSIKNTDEFYKNAEKYWSDIDPTLNGVLGGFGYISDIDLRGSNRFLNNVLNASKKPPARTRALDCGAGIGRITKGLLINHFATVDLVEQNSSFLDEARRSLIGQKQLGNLYACALQNFEPREKYDLIWCQWVLGHLTDSDLVEFLRRCSAALSPRGVIIIKENISADEVVIDEKDSSFTRTSEGFVEIFQKVPLHVSRQALQNNFPDGLFSVKLFALTPVSTVQRISTDPVVKETPKSTVTSDAIDFDHTIPNFPPVKIDSDISLVIPSSPESAYYSTEMPLYANLTSPVYGDVAVASIPTTDIGATIPTIPIELTMTPVPIPDHKVHALNNSMALHHNMQSTQSILTAASDESER